MPDPSASPERDAASAATPCPDSSELARLQARFAAGLLTAGDDPTELFCSDAARSARRFALYRGNLTANWERSLGNAYPVLLRLVGEEFFRALGREFGRARPLTVGDLNCFGDGLPEFLDSFGPVADFPYVPDMARLEWALHRAHYAADMPALDFAALAAMDANGLDTVQLRLRAPCTLLCSGWDIVGIWQAHQVQTPDWPADVGQPSRCLVHRPRWRTEVMPLTPGAFNALLAIADGASLGAALEAGAQADECFDPAAALPRWLEVGVFAATASSDNAGR